MFSAIDLFFILLTAVLLMAAVSLTVAFYSASTVHPDETIEETKPAGEDIVSPLPDAHMTTWHIGNHLADRLPPRSVSENIGQLPFTQTYHLLGDTDLEESQEHPTFTTTVNKTIERTNRQIREMVHLPNRDVRPEPAENENILNH